MPECPKCKKHFFYNNKCNKCGFIQSSQTKSTSNSNNNLIDCNKCQKQVADTAEICPHCGARLKTSFLYKFIKWGLIIGAIFFVFQIILAIIAYNTI